MKRSVSLVLLAAACTLALAAVMMLTGCGVKEPDSGPTGDVPQDPAVDSPTGETASYTSGYVDLALTLPEGWKWEAVQDKSGGTEGVRFWCPDDKALDFRLLCWTKGFGICGTGVTSEEITLANGMKVWQHTEENTEKGTMVMADIFFEDVPGSYVASPSDTMTTEVWNANRDELLNILGTVQLGRKSVTMQAAMDAAKAQYTGEYDQVYATYDVTSGAWTVSFSKSAAGAKTDRLVVDAAGKVMAAGK